VPAQEASAPDNGATVQQELPTDTCVDSSIQNAEKAETTDGGSNLVNNEADQAESRKEEKVTDERELVDKLTDNRKETTASHVMTESSASGDWEHVQVKGKWTVCTCKLGLGVDR